MSKYIAIPFPLLEAAGIANGLLAAIVRRGLELGLESDELPWSGITPRSYRWTENPAQDGSDDTLIRFTLWGGGCGFYTHGTLRGVNGYYGTSWAMEALEVKYRPQIGWRSGKATLRLNAEGVTAVVAAAYQAANPGSYGGVDQSVAADAALDAALAALLSAVKTAKEAQVVHLAVSARRDAATELVCSVCGKTSPAPVGEVLRGWIREWGGQYRDICPDCTAHAGQEGVGCLEARL